MQANKQLKLCLHLQQLATQREDNHWLVVEDIILMSASLSLRLLLLTLRLNIKYMGIMVHPTLRACPMPNMESPTQHLVMSKHSRIEYQPTSSLAG